MPNIFNCKEYASEDHRELAIEHNTNFIENCIPQ
jgi:hypothetical protein